MNRRSFFATITGAILAGPKLVAAAIRPKPLIALNIKTHAWTVSKWQSRGRIDYIDPNLFIVARRGGKSMAMQAWIENLDIPEHMKK